MGANKSSLRGGSTEKVIQWCEGLGFHENIVDTISIASDGRQIIVLIGELHEQISTIQAESLIAHLQKLSNTLKERHQIINVYTEAPRYESTSWETLEKTRKSCNESLLTPSSAVCRHWKEVHSVDPRVMALYDLLYALSDATYTITPEAKFFLMNSVYWDMLTLYNEYVRSEVESRLHRLSQRHRSLVSQQLLTFNDGIEQIRANIKSIKTEEECKTFLSNLHENLFSLSIGLDVLFLADVFIQHAAVSVLFVGSGHVRRMHDVFAADRHWRVMSRADLKWQEKKNH